MTRATKTPSDFISGVLRRRLLVLAVLVASTLLGLWLALALPPVYRSTATILIEQQEIPQDLVRSTVTSYADQRIQIISQRVMTTQNLMEIVRKYGLYEEELSEEPREVVLARMRESIVMDRISADVTDPRTGVPKQAVVAFTLSFSADTPEKSQRVANELVSLYLQENLKTRTESAEQAAGFLQQEADRLRKQMTDVDQRIQVFKQSHQGELPGDPSTSPLALERVNSELIALQQNRRSLEERQVALSNQLRQLEAIYAEGPLEREVLLDSRGNRIQSPKERLKGLELELKGLQSRYAATHPDVVRVQKEVDALQAELSSDAGFKDARLQGLQAELAGLLERYSESHPDVRRVRGEIAAREEQLRTETATRGPQAAGELDKIPAIVELKTQLEVLVLEKQGLRETQQLLEQRQLDLEAKAARAPQLENEMMAMMQERVMLQQSLGDLTRRESEARLAESLESERKGEKLTLIEPPALPEEPASPNRPLVAVLGLVLGVALGIGAAVGLEMLDQRIYGPGVVAALLSAPPLGLIPTIVTPLDRARRRFRQLATGVGAMASLALALAAVHIFLRPLDQLWLQVLYRLGA